MSNAIFEVKGNELWLDIPEPYRWFNSIQKDRLFNDYNNRPHYTIEGSHNWKDGDKIPESAFHKSFKCDRWCAECKAFDWSTCTNKYSAIPINQTTMIEQQDIPMGKIAQAFIDAYKEFNPNMKESHEDILNRIATRAAKNILSMFPQSPKEDIPMEKEHSVQTLKVEKDIANAANSCYLRINSYANPSTMNGIEREWIIKMIEITLTEQKEKWTASQSPKEEKES